MAILNLTKNTTVENDEEKEELHKYLEDILERNDNGKLSNPNDKADWVLYWWKK